MKISLTRKESENIFKDALCSLGYISGYGLSVKFDKLEYEKTRELMTKGQPSWICFEDVIFQILKNGGKISLSDGIDDFPITLSDVHKRMKLVPLETLLDAINQEGDADTDDIILQIIFLEEIIYG